ncbi:patatin-like phospholipase family protein [Vibrio ulleungensis]|uniref:Patatin-like phospholipase family protein n=1 Tax=Vibrio ulleungensis TaxID=2807619 RepID=A0ABS2HLC0_9VIBR|nr:patatin-like phospholipase family protein [Vibrio ulleungensis]MBM7037839.1 patatin-like phospholipase family protein [Vibrio ulleungensis]
MIKALLYIVLSTTLAYSAVLRADEGSGKTIGVVLAGGGAKGAAHIGVLKALEEMQIPVHIITGTSMGAYVGGLYSTGQTADEIEYYLDTVNWNLGYQDQIERSDRRRREKEYQDYYQINTDLGVSLSGTKSPKGVVQGQGMLQILRQTSKNPLPVNSFDEFPIKYRAVATDIVKLRQVVIKDGYLVDAMMASMSVPGALPPYKLDGRLLVDGGVTNNMPVDVARSLGADIVIAVDISSDYLKEENLNSYFSVGGQLSNYLVRRTTEDQRSKMTEQDTYLKPAIQGIGTTDFSQMPVAYRQGYIAAYEQKARLLRYRVSKEEYAAHRQVIEAGKSRLIFGEDVVVENISLENNSNYNEPLLKHRLDIETGNALSIEELESSIDRLYALDRFEKVTYRFEGEKDDGTLVIDVTEKEWGPNYLDFRFFVEEDFNSNSQYGLGVAVNFTGLNDLGGELLLAGDIGTDKSLGFDFYSPLLDNQAIFGNLLVQYTEEERRRLFTLGDIEDLSQIEDYLPVTYTKFKTEVSAGFQPELWADLSVGLRYTKGDAAYSITNSVDEVDFETKSIFVRYVFDTLDSYSLPTKGWYLNLEYAVVDDYVGETREVSGSDEVVYEYLGEWAGAKSFGKHTLSARAEIAYIDASQAAIPSNPYSIGGFLNLSGTPRNSNFGRNKLFSDIVYRYKLMDNDFGLFKSPVYLGGSIEYGGVWSDPRTQIDEAPLFVAGSVFMGIDSPLGPIILAYGLAESSMSSVYFIVGNSF